MYRGILWDRNMEVLEGLAMVEIGQELHGIVPNTFFDREIGFRPIWPLS